MIWCSKIQLWCLQGLLDACTSYVGGCRRTKYNQDANWYAAMKIHKKWHFKSNFKEVCRFTFASPLVCKCAIYMQCWREHKHQNSIRSLYQLETAT